MIFESLLDIEISFEKNLFSTFLGPLGIVNPRWGPYTKECAHNLGRKSRLIHVVSGFGQAMRWGSGSMQRKRGRIHQFSPFRVPLLVVLRPIVSHLSCLNFWGHTLPYKWVRMDHDFLNCVLFCISSPKCTLIFANVILSFIEEFPNSWMSLVMVTAFEYKIGDFWRCLCLWLMCRPV